MRQATGFDKRGKGRRHLTRDDFEPKHKDSPSAIIPDKVGVYFECAEGETRETHLIVRKSLTEKLLLRVIPQQLEFERLADTKRIQTDNKGHRVETTDPRYRLTFKSDATLLRRGKPDTFGEGKGTQFKRVTSRSKRLDYGDQLEIKEAPPICVCGCGRHEHSQTPEGTFTSCYYAVADPKKPDQHVCGCVGYNPGTEINLSGKYHDDCDTL